MKCVHIPAKTLNTFFWYVIDWYCYLKGRGLLLKDRVINKGNTPVLASGSEAEQGKPHRDTTKPAHSSINIQAIKDEPLSKGKLQELLNLIVEKVAQLPDEAQIPPVKEA